jgi:hypothetical protein
MGRSSSFFEVIAASRLIVPGASDAAETRDVLCAFAGYILVLGVLAHPGDHDVFFVSED